MQQASCLPFRNQDEEIHPAHIRDNIRHEVQRLFVEGAERGAVSGFVCMKQSRKSGQLVPISGKFFEYVKDFTELYDEIVHKRNLTQLIGFYLLKVYGR